MDLGLAEQLAPARGRRRQAEAQIVERAERADCANQGKRKKGNNRHQRVGQDVTKNDPKARNAQTPGSLDKGGLAQLQKLGPHVVGNADPVEDGVDEQQQAKAAAKHRAHQNDHIQKGQGAPDFNQALAGDIEPTAEIALDRSDQNPNRKGGGDQDKAEVERDAQRVQDPGEHVAAGVVDAHRMTGQGRKRKAHVEPVEARPKALPGQPQALVLHHPLQALGRSRGDARPFGLGQPWPQLGVGSLEAAVRAKNQSGRAGVGIGGFAKAQPDSGR